MYSSYARIWRSLCHSELAFRVRVRFQIPISNSVRSGGAEAGFGSFRRHRRQIRLGFPQWSDLVWNGLPRSRFGSEAGLVRIRHRHPKPGLADKCGRGTQMPSSRLLLPRNWYTLSHFQCRINTKCAFCAALFDKLTTTNELTVWYSCAKQALTT